MRIWITGGSGQLGSELRQIDLPYRCVFTDENVDLTDFRSVDRFLFETKPHIIVNCAAYTAVDKAESEREAAIRLNCDAVEHLARKGVEQGIYLIHISTDYVFDGQGSAPYREGSPTNPATFYGLSKLKGEQALFVSGVHGAIIRTSWLYSRFGRNFVKKIIRLAKEKKEIQVVDDQIGNPTYAGDLAKAIATILERPKKEGLHLYHYSNEGVASWYDFAYEIVDVMEISCRIRPVESKAYPTAAKRPPYAVMNKAKIKREFGLDIPHWRHSLRRFVRKYRLVEEKR